MRIENYVGLALAALCFAACQSDTYYIKGEAQGLADGTVVYLAEAEGTQRVLDSLVVSDGRFSGEGAATDDAPLFCKLYPKGHADGGLLFFLVTGNIYAELSAETGASRVSGSKINNQWQALNDTVGKYDARLRELFSADSLAPRNVYAETARIYSTLSRRISETAQRNSDNALGRFISSHYTPK